MRGVVWRCASLLLQFFLPAHDPHKGFLFFMAKIVSIDPKVLVRLSRMELYLLLHIAARADLNKEAMITMRELQNSTLYHYQKIYSIRRKLIAKSMLEDTPLNGDTTGTIPQKYVIASDLISPI